MAFGQHDLHAVRQRPALQPREREVGEAGDIRHALAAIDIGFADFELRIDRRNLAIFGRIRFVGGRLVDVGRWRRAWNHDQGVVAFRQPLAASRLELRRGCGVQDRQRLAKTTRVAGEHRALGKCIGLAAETADPFDAADEAGLEDGARLRGFLRARALLDQSLEFLIDDRLDLGRIHTLLDVGADGELAAKFGAGHRRADMVGQLVLMNQTPIQSRGAAAAQHLRE